MSEQTITPPDLETPWPSESTNSPWKEVARQFVDERRSYTIHSVVVENTTNGAFFRAEYSTHELEGWEWGPGEGKDKSAAWWQRVYPRTITTVIYETTN
jgi:hypothetical protein